MPMKTTGFKTNLHVTPHETMKLFIAAFIASALLLPGLAFAKRVAPAEVAPVIREGVLYTAPNDDGRRAYIEAWNVQTGKKLWDLTVFTNRIDPKLEEDVQWVFIKSLTIQDGRLVITSETGSVYRIDLTAKKVIQARRPDGWPEPAVAGAFLSAVAVRAARRRPPFHFVSLERVVC
jgi:outer membrane protein assembly factor BamB